MAATGAKNAIVLRHIHTTWEDYFSPVLYEHEFVLALASWLAARSWVKVFRGTLEIIMYAYSFAFVRFVEVVIKAKITSNGEYSGFE